MHAGSRGADLSCPGQRGWREMRSGTRRRSGRWDVGDAGRTLGSPATARAAGMQGLEAPGSHQELPPETPPVVLPSCGLSSGRLKPSPYPALLLRRGLVRACKQGASLPPSGTGPYSDSGVGNSLEPRGLEYWVRDPLLWFPEGFNLGSHHPAEYLN